MTKRLARPKLSDLILAAALLLAPLDGFCENSPLSELQCYPFAELPCPDPRVDQHLSILLVVSFAVVLRLFEVLWPDDGEHTRLARIGSGLLHLLTRPSSFFSVHFGGFKLWKWILATILLTVLLQEHAYRWNTYFRKLPGPCPTNAAVEPPVKPRPPVVPFGPKPPPVSK